MTPKNAIVGNDIVAYGFSDLVDFIKANCLRRAEGLILLTCYLDAISGIMYPGIGNRARLVKLLVSSSMSREWDRVSLPALLRLMSSDQDHSVQAVGCKMERVFASELLEYSRGINPDLPTAELLKVATGTLTSEVGPRVIHLVQMSNYANIFWHRYRNSLVHSLTVQPSDVPSFGARECPFYADTTDGSSTSDFRNAGLYFPILFLLKSVVDCVEDMRQWANENDIDLCKRWV